MSRPTLLFGQNSLIKTSRSDLFNSTPRGTHLFSPSPRKFRLESKDVDSETSESTSTSSSEENMRPEWEYDTWEIEHLQKIAKAQHQETLRKNLLQSSQCLNTRIIQDSPYPQDSLVLHRQKRALERSKSHESSTSKMSKKSTPVLNLSGKHCLKKSPIEIRHPSTIKFTRSPTPSSSYSLSPLKPSHSSSRISFGRRSSGLSKIRYFQRSYSDRRRKQRKRKKWIEL